MAFETIQLSNTSYGATHECKLLGVLCDLFRVVCLQTCSQEDL